MFGSTIASEGLLERVVAPKVLRGAWRTQELRRGRPSTVYSLRTCDVRLTINHKLKEQIVESEKHRCPGNETPPSKYSQECWQIILRRMARWRGVTGEMCSGSEAGSYLRPTDFVYHSTLGLRVIKRERGKTGSPPLALNVASKMLTRKLPMISTATEICQVHQTLVSNPRRQSHMGTLVIHKLGSTKFTTQNDLH